MRRRDLRQKDGGEIPGRPLRKRETGRRVRRHPPASDAQLPLTRLAQGTRARSSRGSKGGLDAPCDRAPEGSKSFRVTSAVNPAMINVSNYLRTKGPHVHDFRL